jgi:glucose-6-phosphate 1-dehydrogenase
MQVVSATAMEPPAGGDPATLKDSQLAVYRSIATASPAEYVRGQYDGYLKTEGVAAGSTTETYAALRLDIDNWRWSGVPFFIRTGKYLRALQTEVRLVFKRPPRLGFARLQNPKMERNQVAVRLDPSAGIQFVVDALHADEHTPRPIMLEKDFAKDGRREVTPYEVLLHAAMVGISTRFSRQDCVEETWRIMQPLLDNPPPVHPYAVGSWGPAEADELVAEFGGWSNPWIAS